VNTVYQDPTLYKGVPLILATFFFCFQIYCDFSGYTDIAKGSAKLFGIDLRLNLRRPYLARSIGDFWKRWYISLTSWFRDYVYVPLGGNKSSGIGWIRNVAIVFLISGLWHGANWTFVIWGAVHASMFFIEKFTLRARNSFWLLGILRPVKNIRPLLANVTVFLLVFLAWVFFRAETVSDALYILNNLFVDLSFKYNYTQTVGLGPYEIIYCFMAVFALMISDCFCEWAPDKWVDFTKKPLVSWPLTMLLICVIIFYGATNQVTFIYFQF